jgi:phosphoribosyl 1,2-cyclic phosphodiesterase
MNVNFCSLSSGSSGNCYYLGNGFQGILIDAGISATSIRKFLKNMDIPMENIMGVLITHNHIDHIKGLELLTRKIPFLHLRPEIYGKASSLLTREFRLTVSVKYLFSKSFIWQDLI